jgi:predicted AAA+ superfamily ATPase
MMIARRLRPVLEQRLEEEAAVVLLGPRQSGKTTLALELAAGHAALYLDLESERDRAKLAEPELYLAEHLERLVVLDEIHRAPGLFPVLRGLIDRSRRSGRRTGLFLLLGSAALDLMRQSGETLAGRVSYLELQPFDVLEVGPTSADRDRLWLRGGFPESFLATSHARSLRWRQDFIRSYLERDIPLLGPRIAADRLRRFWTMLAHHQGGVLNVAQLARNLGVDAKTAGGYIDLLADLLLVRRLLPWHANVGKRLVKSPKVYVRDSGLVHALLDIGDKDTLVSHPVLGASWEGFVVEQLLAAAPDGTNGHFYGTSAGAEVDLLLHLPGGGSWAIEIRRSLSPRPEKGFYHACADLSPERRFIVYPGDERYPLNGEVDAIPLPALALLLAEESR